MEEGGNVSGVPPLFKFDATLTIESSKTFKNMASSLGHTSV